MRYRYLAIEGNIGAGKTSLSTRIAQELKARLILEEFAENPFLPKFYEDPERYAFPLELSFLAERFSQLKHDLDQPDLFGSHVVSDYFLSKSLVFSRNNLKDDEYTLFSKMFQLIIPQIPKPDLLVYLYLDIDRLQHNIKKRGRPYELQITDKYLSDVQNNYFEFIRKQDDLRVLIIDTNRLDFVNKEDDYKKILNLINQDYPLGMNHVNA
jgi:deoxyguanosine kinase